jgi:hypothetical protein
MGGSGGGGRECCAGGPKWITLASFDQGLVSFLGLTLNSPDASDIVCCVLSPGSLCHCGQSQPSLMGILMAVDAV